MTNNGNSAQTGRKGITNEAIIEALHNSGGIEKIAADKLGCSKQNINKRINNNKKLQEAKEAAIAEVGDLSKSVIITAMMDVTNRPAIDKDGNEVKDKRTDKPKKVRVPTKMALDAAKFWARTKLKHEGFTEGHEVKGTLDFPDKGTIKRIRKELGLDA